jgi:serine protease Do
MNRISLSETPRRIPRTIAVALAVTILATSGIVEADNTAAINSARALSQAFRQAAENTIPAVVTVLSKAESRIVRGRNDLRDLLNDPRLRELFPEGRIPFDIEEGEDGPKIITPPDLNQQVGSGVIIDNKGLVLTNNHVVTGATEVVVRFEDGTEVKAKEVLTDPLSDIAVVRIEPRASMHIAKLGDSSELEIGDWVIAVGSPFELEATVSAGIISGKGRGIQKIRRGRLIQTDAAINPGNSGGPLVNLDGEVVGINTAIATSSGGYQGIGFAIPINRAKWVSRELAEYGRVRRAYLGIQIAELTPEAALQLQLAARSGVVVVNAIESGPAAIAGIERNDVIVEFAGERVRGPRDLQDVVEQKPLGSTQEVKVKRSGRTLSFRVRLEALPD